MFGYEAQRAILLDYGREADFPVLIGSHAQIIIDRRTCHH